jgi:hypothetical protein
MFYANTIKIILGDRQSQINVAIAAATAAVVSKSLRIGLILWVKG